MAIDKTSRPDMESNVFLEDPLRPTLPAKAVVVQNSVAEPVNVSGEFVPSGLTIALKVTNTTVGSTAAMLPLTALTDRNSLIIFNRSSSDSIYIGNSDVTDSGALEGWIIDPGSYFSLDVTNDIPIYAVASVASVNVKILEMA